MVDDLSVYLPIDRRAALLRDAMLPDRAHGAVMFADVTGFTPLAESLVQALGSRRGAEELTALLNQVYSALITQIEQFGGSVVGFSGDAITCWFDDGDAGRMTKDESKSLERSNAYGTADAHSPLVFDPASAALRTLAAALRCSRL
jgi:class 3 adenylate cyclase